MTTFDHLPLELANGKGLIAQHRAALTIQSFFRRSQYIILVERNHYYGGPTETRPSPMLRMNHPRQPGHGKANFAQGQLLTFTRAIRTLSQPRYKPLGVALTMMMRRILVERRHCKESERMHKKRKNFFFRVSLMLRRKHFGDIRLLTVTHETKFH